MTTIIEVTGQDRSYVVEVPSAASHVVGVPGLPGPPGADGTFGNDRGVWDGETSYAAGDVVTSGGSVWKAAAEPSGEPGTDAAWVLRISKGGKGDPGDPGATGPQGPAGADGAAGPQGDAGATGPQGPQGPAGENGADGATGPQGPAGADGADGADGTNGTPLPSMMDIGIDGNAIALSADADTMALADAGAFRWDLKAEQDGQTSTLAAGGFVVEAAVTRMA